MDRGDEQADKRDRTADARDDAADESDRTQDALDRRGDESDQRDLAALFEEATSELDREVVDEALSKVDWQAQVVASVNHDTAVQQLRRSGSLVVAMDNIRDAREGLERAQTQGRPVVELQRRGDELHQASEAYQRLLLD